jgi:hypothetical protein
MTKITDTGLKEGMSRLKSTVKNDALGGLNAFEGRMRFALDELERAYRTRNVL